MAVFLMETGSWSRLNCVKLKFWDSCLWHELILLTDFSFALMWSHIQCIRFEAATSIDFHRLTFLWIVSSRFDNRGWRLANLHVTIVFILSNCVHGYNLNYFGVTKVACIKIQKRYFGLNLVIQRTNVEFFFSFWYKYFKYSHKKYYFLLF